MSATLTAMAFMRGDEDGKDAIGFSSSIQRAVQPHLQCRRVDEVATSPCDDCDDRRHRVVSERTMTITTAASDGGITIVDRAIATTAETAIGAARRMTTALNGASAIGETGAARSLRRRPPIETLVDRRAMLSRRGHRHRRRPRQSRPRLLRRVKAHSVCTVNYRHVRSLLSKIIRMYSRPSKLTILVSPSSVPPPAHTSALAGRANR